VRTYGRIDDGFGNKKWVEVEVLTAETDDPVWVTTLIQTLKLILGESPFYANYGIPAQQSVIQQIFPDFYVARTQQQYSKYFSSLIVSKVPGTRSPVYNVNIVTKAGTRLTVSIPT
jgi:hypothetical protein